MDQDVGVYFTTGVEDSTWPIQQTKQYCTSTETVDRVIRPGEATRKENQHSYLWYTLAI